MLEGISSDNILFLDIETVPVSPDFQSLPENFQKLWEKKSSYFRKDQENPADVYQRAGIYAEFGKIICISVGYLGKKENSRIFRIKSFVSDDEYILLDEFARMLQKLTASRPVMLCAHNGKEFDFPYIARRMIVHRITLPSVLDMAGKKPWETGFIDTMELWKFGDYKSYTSLELLTALFGIPTPKDDIDGSMVCDIYWKDKDLKRISTYCEKDVIAVAQLFLRYRNEPFLEEKEIEIVN